MRIEQIEIWPVRVPYTHAELSSLVAREGVTDVIVRLTADNGLHGWGECTRAADAAGIACALAAMRPIVQGRDPFDMEAILRDVFIAGAWQFQPMTGNFAFAGIDMALWDLCAKACGQPLYRLFGGAVRERVDYFCYLNWGPPEAVAEQCRDGVERGYTVFYLKVGVDAAAEEAMLAAIRRTIGPHRKIRIDANQAWTVPEATRLAHRLARKVRDRLRRGAGADRSGPADAGPQAPGAGAALRQRGPLARGRRVPDHRQPLRRFPVLQLLLGRHAPPLPVALPCCRGQGLAGLQAHPRRARPRGGRGPAPDADPTQRLRRPPADRAVHGGRHPDRAAADRDRPDLGPDRSSRTRGRGRRAEARPLPPGLSRPRRLPALRHQVRQQS